MKLIFATNNQHKVEEVKAVVRQPLQIVSLAEAGIEIDVPEPFDTLEENASTKSLTIYELVKSDKSILGCFSEDTGLEVAALNGDPGVKSARYAGEERSFERNIEKLLYNLSGKEDPSARFRAVISLVMGGQEYQFEGICPGHIIKTTRGNQGFGYDPIFVPDGASKTFGEMELTEKQVYSHRAKATQKLVTFLNTLEPIKKI